MMTNLANAAKPAMTSDVQSKMENTNTSTLQKVVSVVIPVFNEEENIEAAYRAVCEVFASVADRYALEIIFTDNHSDDKSFEIISRLGQSDKRVRGIRFTRNFGFHRS